MDWNQVAEQNRNGFQHAIIEMAGNVNNAKAFIDELKFFKFDLSNNMILYAIMQEPSILTNLFTIYQSGVPKRIQTHIQIIKEKQSTVKTTEDIQMNFVALVGGRELALDFLKELKQLGLDLTEENKLSLMHKEVESFRLLSIYYGLGFISKIINTQQAIENILKKEKIIWAHNQKKQSENVSQDKWQKKMQK